MGSEELEKLLNDLREYRDEERGRRAEVARTLGISPSGLWNVLSHKQEPTGSQALKILAILRRR